MDYKTNLGVQLMPLIMAVSGVAFYALNNKLLCGLCLFFCIASWAVLLSEGKNTSN